MEICLRFRLLRANKSQIGQTGKKELYWAHTNLRSGKFVFPIAMFYRADLASLEDFI